MANVTLHSTSNYRGGMKGLKGGPTQFMSHEQVRNQLRQAFGVKG